MKVVYLLKDPLTNLPFYVGKGNDKRPHQHWRLICSGKNTASRRLTSFLRKMQSEDRVPIIEIYEVPNNEEARLLETDLIKQWGRVDYEENGILLNHRLEQTDWTGRRHTVESREKISQSRKGWKQSPEHADKLRKANTGRKHPPRSEEWKQKQRASHLGRKDSLEALLNKSFAHTGAKNPRAKQWTIQHEENMRVEKISALKTWCREHDVSFYHLCNTRKTGLFYRGMRVLNSQ